MIAALPVPASATAPVLKGVAAASSRSSDSESNGFAHALAQADGQTGGEAAPGSAGITRETPDKNSDPLSGPTSTTQTSGSASKALLDSPALLSPGDTDVPAASDDAQAAPGNVTAAPLSPPLVSDVHQRSIPIGASLKNGKDLSGGQLQKEGADKASGGKGKALGIAPSGIAPPGIAPSGIAPPGNQSPAFADVMLPATSAPVELPQSATTQQPSKPSSVQEGTVGTTPAAESRLAPPPASAAQRPRVQSAELTSTPTQTVTFSESLLPAQTDKPAAQAAATTATASVTVLRATTDLTDSVSPPSKPAPVQDGTVGTTPATESRNAPPLASAAQRPRLQSTEVTSTPPRSVAFSETLLPAQTDKPAAQAAATTATASVTVLRATTDLTDSVSPPSKPASPSQPLNQPPELARASRADSGASIGSTQALQPVKSAPSTDQRSPSTSSDTQQNLNGAALTLLPSAHVAVLPATVHPAVNSGFQPMATPVKVEGSAALQPAISSATNLLGVDAAHTVHDARGGGLEVGFHDGTLGWLSIRASIDNAGDLSATVGSRSQTATSAVSTMLPALGRFLQQENISIHNVSTASPSAALPLVAGGSGASMSHSGGGLPADTSGQAGAGANPEADSKRDRPQAAWAGEGTLHIRERPTDYTALPGIASAQQSGTSLLSVRI